MSLKETTKKTLKIKGEVPTVKSLKADFFEREGREKTDRECELDQELMLLQSAIINRLLELYGVERVSISYHTAVDMDVVMDENKEQVY